MYLHPELVLPLGEAGNGKSRQFKVQALNENWAWAERQWSKVSRDTGVGDPHLATAEKGKAFMEFLVERYSRFVLELSKLDPKDDIYE